MGRTWSVSLCVLAALGLPLGAAAQPIRLGREFQVNSYTTISQSQPVVAASADGDFVVVWQSFGQDPASWGVFGRRFSSAGLALATEFQVNSYTTRDQRYPAVAASADGDFVVAWESLGQDSPNYPLSPDLGVFARRFSSAGSALASEFQVNSYTNGDQRYPAVAASADGDFVVAWQSYGQDSTYASVSLGVFARRFSSAGSALASEFQVNFYTIGGQFLPAVAADGDGDFVVVWRSVNFGPFYDVFARRFSSAGLALASEFQVNSYTTNQQRSPTVAAFADGDFVVVWESGQDGSLYGVFARRFSSAGSALASEFQVNSYTTYNQRFPAVAASADGDFVVVWESDQDGSFNGVFARRFSSAGLALASEFQVNSYTTSYQRRAAVAEDGDGDFVIAWDSNSQDGSGYGVFAQRFGVPIRLDIDGDGTVNALTDGLLAVRYLFGFRGVTLVTGAVDVGGCTRCDASSIEAYLAVQIGVGAGEVRLGTELQVNSFTTDNQRHPAVAADGDGDFIVAWESNAQDGSLNGVFARRFSRTGSGLASELQINFQTANSQRYPAVAARSNGDFVVVWSSLNQDGSDNGIFARRFSSAGSAFASELQVNTYTINDQVFPAVAAQANGDFIVAWTSNGQDGSSQGVFARRFSSAGSALASEFQVNTWTTDYQRYAAVAMDADGDFVVAWESYGSLFPLSQDGWGTGVFARRFSSAGVALAGEFQVNSYTTYDQRRPAVAAEDDGDFVVAWESIGQDGPHFGIFAQRFSSAGLALASEFQVNSYTTDGQRHPAVADGDGDFVIAWESFGEDGSSNGVFARRFSSAGSALAGEFQVHTHTANSQSDPAVAANAGGDFVVAWESFGQDDLSANPPIGYGVFAQRFAVEIALDVDGNGVAQPLTDGLLALRYAFGLRGAALVAGAVDVDGCTRCDAPAIEAYLAGIES